MKNLVLYHGDCYDGFGAAWSARKVLKDDADYKPVNWNQDPPPYDGYENIYIVDFCYPPKVLRDMANYAHVVVLDHHKTSQEWVKDLKHPEIEVYFDMNRSGASMTWDYFNPKEEMPKLIKFIEARDLWKKDELEGTDYVHMSLVSHPFDFKVWDKLATDEGVEQMLKDGPSLLRLYEALVEKICKAAWLGTVAEYEVPIVNTSIAWSEVGNKLLEKFPDAPFAASFTVFEGKQMWSLRSRKGFDVAKIGEKYDGGGHGQAAGFSLPIKFEGVK